MRAQLPAKPTSTENRRQPQVELIRDKRRFTIGLDRFSGIYVLVVLCLAFSFWLPHTFPTSENIRVVAEGQAVTGILALGALIPLAAGVIDISIAAVMGLAAVITITLQSDGWNAILASAVAIAAAGLVGAVNGAVIIRMRIDPLIETLGMSSVIAAATYKVTNGQQVVNGISRHFLSIGTASWFHVPAPVYYFAVIAVGVWFVTEYRPVGRHLYAVGGSREASRLAGLRVDRTVFGAMIAGSMVAGGAGVLLAAELGIGDPTSGPPYLLPVFSAVFLGATQVRPGRVNVPGTLIAVYLLAVGVKGLQLGGAPSYVSDLFNGLALIVAVSLAAYDRRKA